MTRLALLAVLLCSCGGPLLRNVPAPDPAVVAGIAAATAGALTLASPQTFYGPAEQPRALPIAAYPLTVGTDPNGETVYSFGEPTPR